MIEKRDVGLDRDRATVEVQLEFDRGFVRRPDDARYAGCGNQALPKSDDTSLPFLPLRPRWSIGVKGMTAVPFSNTEFLYTESDIPQRVVPGPMIYAFAEGLLVDATMQHTGFAFLNMRL